MNQNQGVWRQQLGELRGALVKGVRRSNLVNAGAVLTPGAAGIGGGQRVGAEPVAVEDP